MINLRGIATLIDALSVNIVLTIRTLEARIRARIEVQTGRAAGYALQSAVPLHHATCGALGCVLLAHVIAGNESARTRELNALRYVY